MFFLTTSISFCEHENDLVEARVGICFGSRSSMDIMEMANCEYNPFHKDFTDHYMKSMGKNKEEASENLMEALYGLPENEACLV